MGCVFLYNPRSGKGKIVRKIGYIEQRLRDIFGEVRVIGTASAEDAAARAAEWSARGEAVVFAGGDGTFNAVLQGVAGRGATIGYIPSGTVNDAAGTLGIPKNVRRALRAIAHRRTAQVDCMQINGKRYAFCIVAAGALTRVTYETPQREKRRFGWFAYAFEAFRRIRRAQVFYAEAESGGERVAGEFALALVLNGKKVARFSVNRGASIHDGKCETLLVRQNGRGFFARAGAYFAVARLLLFGVGRGGKRVARLRGEWVRIRKTDSVLWDFDGEKGCAGEIDVRVLRGAVKVFVPD